LSAPSHTDASDYRLESPGEILAWLRELLQGQVRLQLSTPEGGSLHTVLRAVDAPHGMLSLEAPQDSGALQAVLDSDELVASAFLDRIKLQFELPGLLQVRATDGSSVLRAPLPAQLYRFQRRQAYRVHSASSLYPALRLADPAQPRLRVLNLSAGGLALQWPTELALPYAQGEQIQAATLELERDIALPVQLRVQHVVPGPGPHQRLGCAFVALAPAPARALQLFIDQAQKRERLVRKP
jgi:c-di-GMP-binding flagellar brake protein YcgR